MYIYIYIYIYLYIYIYIYIYIYNLQVIRRPFYLQLRDNTDFKWTPELQQTFYRVKKKLTDGKLRLAIPNSEKNTSLFFAIPLTMELEQHSYRKINLEKWN